LAALKAVGESVEKSLDYYQNNVSGTINLLQVMRECNVKNIVFSSSCTVYGNPAYLPLDEKHPLAADLITNPYGKTKYFVEQILKDIYASDKVFLLCFFCFTLNFDQWI